MDTITKGTKVRFTTHNQTSIGWIDTINPGVSASIYIDTPIRMRTLTGHEYATFHPVLTGYDLATIQPVDPSPNANE